jgi:hypothetical protein
VPVNRQQNDWTQRQLFNPDTLVLRSADGNQVTVNAATGRPGDEVVTLPVPGTVVGFIQSAANVTQQLTNTKTAINLQTTGDGYQITRAGPNFTVHANGKFYVGLGVRVLQQQNNNLTRFWVEINGVAFPYFGVSCEPTAAGDAISTISQGYINANAGDVFAFYAITTSANGASLEGLAAAAPAPAIAAAWVDMLGYLR